MDEGLSDTDTADTASECRPDYLVAVGVGVATNVNCKPSGMCGVARAPALQVPLTGTISAVQHKRNARSLPNQIKGVKKAGVHLRNIAGRFAFAEFRRLEVSAHYNCASISALQASIAEMSAGISLALTFWKVYFTSPSSM